MSDVLVVLCTFPSPEQAREIGRTLVDRQLAACVNLIPAIESIYRWRGAVESATETLALFKTTAATWPEFEKTLTELHPYEVPEIIAVKPAEIAGTYARWVNENVVG